MSASAFTEQSTQKCRASKADVLLRLGRAADHVWFNFLNIAAAAVDLPQLLWH